MSPRTGRPRLPNAKKVRMGLKLREDEAAILEECAERLKVPRTQVITKGIRMVKAELDSHDGK